LLSHPPFALGFFFLLKSEFSVPYLHDLCLKRKLQNLEEEEEEVSVVDDRRENSRIHKKKLV
jgi:hypothetical protein